MNYEVGAGYRNGNNDEESTVIFSILEENDGVYLVDFEKFEIDLVKIRGIASAVLDKKLPGPHMICKIQKGLLNDICGTIGALYRSVIYM